MKGSETTMVPAAAGHGRSSMSWASRIALLALALTAIFALPGVARAAGPAANIDQCRNGTFASPNQCTGNAWENGNLGGTNSHYRETDTVPFRALLTGLATGESYTLSINYDTLQSGVHAYDYLKSVDATEHDADPTSGVAGLGTGTTFAIPIDSTIVFPQAGAVQESGSISIWNGTITGIAYGGDSTSGTQTLLVTFTANSSTVLLAWGGHIASQLDWGVGQSASAISGSPYHMRLLQIVDNTTSTTTQFGNQDRSLKADAIPPIPTVTTQASSATFALGNTVFDTATLTGTNGAVAGTIQFQTCGPNLVSNPACDASNSTDFGAPVAIGPTGVAVSPTFTPPGLGHYCFRVKYTPAAGALYSPTAATNVTTECFNVTAAGATVTTAIHNAAHATITSAAIGTLVHDSVTVSGGIGTPTGAVTFTVYATSDCSGTGTAQAGGTLSSGTFDNTANATAVGPNGQSYIAHYGGNSSYGAAEGVCEHLTATKLTPTVATTIHNGAHQAITSAAIGTLVHDSVSVTGANATPSGAVTFTLYATSSCSGTGTAQAGGTLSGGTFDNTGNETAVGASGLAYVAHYAGDAVYNSGDGSCEQLSPNKLTPTVATTIHNADHGAITSAPIGTTVHDSATVTGGAGTPAGSVTFTVYANSNCSGDGAAQAGGTLSGGSFDNTLHTSVLTNDGLSYVAHYSGSDVYLSADGSCEQLTATKLASTVATDVHNSGHQAITSAPIGTTVHDHATVSGSAAGGTPTGDVVFAIYSQSNCDGENSTSSDPVTLAVGQAESGTTNVAAGGLAYRAHYLGSTIYNGSFGACEPLEALKLTPGLSTTASPNVLLGGALSDVAHLSGGFDPQGEIQFSLFGPSDSGCTGQPVFTDTQSVDGAGDYTSASFTSNGTGTYHWVATYSGDDNNNSVTEDCGSANESTAVSSPSISITKSPKTQTILSGSTASFTLVVKNTGDVTLTNVTVADPLAPNCARTFESLAPGASETISCTLGNVTASFTNTATATGHPPVGPDVTSSDTAAVTVIHPAISIAKGPDSQSIDAGGTATFTIVVTNTGDVALANVTVTDAQAPNCAKAIGDLAPAATSSYTCALAGVNASFTNSATATGHPTVGPDVTATDTAGVTVNATPPPPPPPPPPLAPQIDLQITKADSPDPSVLGNQLRYLITVKNNGPATAHNVQMSDPLPGQVTFSSVATTQGTCTGGQLVSCQLGTIANGASVTITVFVTTNVTGVVLNTATTVGTEAETNTANNSASASTLVKGPFKPPVVVQGCYAVAVAPHGLVAGKRQTLTLSVRMLGKPAKNARVRVTGAGVRKTSGPTNAKGIVRLSIKPAKPGILRFQPLAHKGCAVPRIGVIGAFTPPVTG
jgi:uncharacterized repeat protein (TIGR01451 family)